MGGLKITQCRADGCKSKADIFMIHQHFGDKVPICYKCFCKALELIDEKVPVEKPKRGKIITVLLDDIIIDKSYGTVYEDAKKDLLNRINVQTLGIDLVWRPEEHFCKKCVQKVKLKLKKMEME
tara:strand:+ start:219 stop:590 length:372 start_codon:yes stop_codon:yes gene_type:complete